MPLEQQSFSFLPQGPAPRENHEGDGEEEEGEDEQRLEKEEQRFFAVYAVSQDSCAF